jgi:CHASE2 domain-containing sensor protein
MGSQEFLTAAFAVTVVFVIGFVASVLTAFLAWRPRTEERAIVAAIVCAVLAVVGAAATFVSLTLNLARGGR